MYTFYFHHVFKTIMRIGHRIIRADRRRTDSQRLHIPRRPLNTVQFGQNVRTIIAYDHDLCPLESTDLLQTIDLPTVAAWKKLCAFQPKL